MSDSELMSQSAPSVDSQGSTEPTSQLGSQSTSHLSSATGLKSTRSAHGKLVPNSTSTSLSPVLSTSVSNAKAQGHSALPNTGKDSNKQSAAGLIGLAAATLSLGVLGSKRKKEEEK
ncbi:hypothetical protein R078131_00959 [Convivina intestini]|nr:hypothetical protein R078131_00959 [Convivina intestini]